MTDIALVQDPHETASVLEVAGLPVLDADVVVRESPDSRWALVDRRGRNIGRCSLWWSETPSHGDHRIGVIGHYAASDGSAARQLLAQACDELQRHGCTMAVGPMDGNTWRNYRLVTEHGSHPPFFLEPTNPPDWPDHFLTNGFQILAEYFSALNSDLGREAPMAKRIGEEMSRLGVQIRPLDSQQFVQDLRRIYSVATSSFQENLLYTRITVEELIDLYRPLQNLVDHDFVLIAEHHGQPIGFIFALPDLCQAERGEQVDTLIVKTLAIQPGQTYTGLGYLLLERVRSKAYESGYTRLIHALVRDVAHLRRMTDKFARQIRRYALFSKELRG